VSSRPTWGLLVGGSSPVRRTSAQLGGGERSPARADEVVGRHGVGERVERVAARLGLVHRAGAWVHREARSLGAQVLLRLGAQGCYALVLVGLCSPPARLWREQHETCGCRHSGCSLDGQLAVGPAHGTGERFQGIVPQAGVEEVLADPVSIIPVEEGGGLAQHRRVLGDRRNALRARQGAADGEAGVDQRCRITACGGAWLQRLEGVIEGLQGLG
jgi:hypothetical protein